MKKRSKAKRAKVKRGARRKGDWHPDMDILRMLSPARGGYRR